MKKSDFAVGIYLLLAIIFLIVPMNSFLLDILLALNISIAMIVLFNAMFSKEILICQHFQLYCYLQPYFEFPSICLVQG